MNNLKKICLILLFLVVDSRNLRALDLCVADCVYSYINEYGDTISDVYALDCPVKHFSMKHFPNLCKNQSPPDSQALKNCKKKYGKSCMGAHCMDCYSNVGATEKLR